MMKHKHLISVAFMGLLCFIMIPGCEHGTQGDGFAYGDSSVPVEDDKDKDKEEPAPVNNFIGTWKLTPTSGGASKYAFFYEGGSWKICDNADTSGECVYGSYSVSGSTLNGTTATGAISATITDGVMTLDFIKKTPSETVRYTGSRL